MGSLLGLIWAKLIKNIVRGKAIRYSKIDKTAKINSGCNIVRTSMDRYSYCGYDCVIVNAQIGAFCSIADFVKIGLAEHPIEWVSTSPVFQNSKNSGPSHRFAHHQVPPGKFTRIGNDVWVGAGAVIKAGVTVGDGAVIGSNAVVTKDVPPYAIVGGSPARLIRYRFDEATITKLLETKWWDMSDDELLKHGKCINNVNVFLNSVSTATRKMN